MKKQKLHDYMPQNWMENSINSLPKIGKTVKDTIKPRKAPKASKGKK